MNDIQRYFPNNQLKNLADDLAGVNTWDDFARRFLLGSGNSPRTTATYLEGCRQFYDFTGGLHPMQAGTPEWIEQFYDSLIARKLDLNTAVLRIRSLKFMYKKIQERYPFYSSPFDIMDKRLKDKLNRSKKDESERGALTLDEYRAILKMLTVQGGLIAVQDYALLRFAVSTGLRAAELVNLTWECFSTTDEGWAVTFVGKGQKRATIQVEEESFRACRRAFKARWGRAPRPTEKVFNSTTTEGITKAAIHIRIKGIGEQAKAAGILRPNFNLSTHTLRHTTATRLIALGCDLRTIQLHMRHSSLATTQRYLNERVDLRPYWKKMNGEAA